MTKQQRITDKQLRAVYTIARIARGRSAATVDALCIRVYRCVPADLSKAQASQFIDFVKFSEE